ncbi:MAG: transcriptional regulator [Gelidibacter sp.]
MTSIITGDIIKSRTVKSPEIWLSILKNALQHLEKDTSKWELYRGDSFQIEIDNIQNSFINAIYIKACLKTIKGLDARLAIGLGQKSFKGQKITESNGEVFQFSGDTLEQLKKEKVNLKIKTANETFNKEINLYFKLALIVMDNWTTNSAEIVKLSIEQPDALQETLGKQLGINQNAISSRQKRAHLDELLELDVLFRQKLNQLS